MFGAVWACIEPSVGVAQSGRDGRLILPAEAYGVCFAPIVLSDGGAAALLPHCAMGKAAPGRPALPCCDNRWRGVMPSAVIVCVTPSKMAILVATPVAESLSATSGLGVGVSSKAKRPANATTSATFPRAKASSAMIAPWLNPIRITRRALVSAALASISASSPAHAATTRAGRLASVMPATENHCRPCRTVAARRENGRYDPTGQAGNTPPTQQDLHRSTQPVQHQA